MNITCNKEILLNNLNIVSKAVSNKTISPILECILLTANEDGFKLISNNLEIAIETTSIESSINKKGSIALEAKIFIEIIKSLPNDEVNIEVLDNNLTIIKSGITEFKIAGQNGNEFPKLNTIEKNSKYTLNCSMFKNMIRQTIFSVSIDESRPVLTGELFEINENKFNIVAIDGFRVSYRKHIIENSYEPISAIIPAKTLNEISKILPDKDDSQVNLYFNDNSILFETESCILTSRLLEGEFLNYNQVFTDDFSTLIQIHRQDFIKTLERACLLSKEAKKNPVKLEIKENGLLIVTSNTEFGTSYDEINITFEGEELIIAFNPKYLIDALKAIEDETIKLQFMTALSPCIIRGVDNDNYKYLVLPLRLKE